MESPQCILSPSRLKFLFKSIGFLFLIGWILFGNYGTSKEAQTSLQRRKLLSIGFNEDNNTSYDGYECGDIHNFTEEYYCKFVQNVESCKGDGFIPYFEFVYCAMPYDLIPLSMILLAFWLLYLFLFLGTTAEEFFCVALTYITKLLRLSQNVAGVTLLAIGNGAPDIFSVMAAFNHPDPKRTSLAFGALFGAGMYVTAFVVCLVILLNPFMLTRRPFLRDNIFYLFAAYWALFMLWENKMNLGVAIGFFVLYLTYVAVVIFGTLIYQRWLKDFTLSKIFKQRGSVPKPSTTDIVITGSSVSRSDSGIATQDTNIDEEEDERRMSMRGPTVEPKQENNQESNSDNNDIDEGEAQERPRTPAERASQLVYGTPTDDINSKEYNLSTRPITPQVRPSSRIEQVIGTVVEVAEDIMVGGNPNLAKVWHQTYKNEKDEERGVSRGTTPRIEEETRYESLSSSQSSTIEAEGNMKEEVYEGTPLIIGNNRNRSFKTRQCLALVKLLSALFPFGSSFRSLRLLRKIFYIIKFPVCFLLILTIPTVDKRRPLNNWNKWLSIIHCVVSPVFASLTTRLGLYCLGNVPSVILFLAVGLILAVVVAITSSPDKAPIYHCVFAWAGFAVSVVWIYTIANEIVNLLQVFGVVIGLSDGILGITLLAWGNSIQDTVTNLTMAKQGFPRMAIGACFGGPLLNMLIGIGLASVVKLATEQKLEFELNFTQVEMVAGLFLLFSISSSLVVTSCLCFKMHRFYSLYLFILYILFLVIVILAELKVFTIELEELKND